MADDEATGVAVATDWREAPAEHEALIAAERKEAEASPKSGARTELVQKRIMGLMAAEGATRALLAALAVAGLLGLAALASSAPDAEGRRKLQFGPAGIIIPAVYPAASAALGQTF